MCRITSPSQSNILINVWEFGGVLGTTVRKVTHGNYNNPSLTTIENKMVHIFNQTFVGLLFVNSRIVS